MKPEFVPRHLFAGWIVAAALVFACSYYFMTRDNKSYYEHEDITGPSTNSRSAIGYAGAWKLLDKFEIPVRQGVIDPSKPDVGDAAIVMEPSSENAVLEQVKQDLRLPRSLLILPKRKGIAADDQPGYIGRDELLPDDDVAKVLAVVDSHATLRRPQDAIKIWQADERFPDPPSLADPQIIESKLIRPLVNCSQGILIGELSEPNRRVLIVSDPDLFENHGLGPNARLWLKLIGELRSAGGVVVFDETIHGFNSRPSHTGRILFEWPFVLVTVQIAIAIALLLWASIGRFGAPRKPPPELGYGTASLIESGARLLDLPGSSNVISAKYTEAMLRETAIRIHAPRSLSAAALRKWFQGIGRPAPEDFPVATHDQALAAARTVYLWRCSILDESRQRSKHS